MNCQPMSQPRRMREQFRVAIRRQKKQQIFRTLRSKQKTVFVEEEQRKMLLVLDTRDKREEYILRKARDLAGHPDQTWRYIMNELYWSLLCFKGNGCFKIWIQSSLIKILCLLFQEDYLHLGLGPEAAKLLGSAIYLEEEQEEDKTSYIAQQVFNLEIIDHVINMVRDPSLPHSEISHLVTLLGNLAHNDVQTFIKHQGMTVVVDWSLRMLKERKINRAYLEQIYCFFQLMSHQIAKIPANINFAEQVFSVFGQFLQIEQSNELLSHALNSVTEIIKYHKEGYISTFLQKTRLVKRIMELACGPHESIRLMCWNILGYVSVGHKVTDTLLNYYFLDVIWKAYNIEPLPDGNSDKITEYMLVSISNMAAEDDEVRDILLRHPVMNLVYDSTHEQRSTNLRKSAYYCLCTFLTTKNYNICRKVLFETPIYEKLVLGLDQMIDKDAYTVREILLVLYDTMKEDRKVYRYHEEQLIDILESKYCLMNIVTRAQERYHNHSLVSNVCDNIFDLASTN